MFLRSLLFVCALSAVAACTSNNSGGGGNNPPPACGGVNTPGTCAGGTPAPANYCYATAGAACVQAVPLCDGSHLTPFVPVGAASRVSQIPAGSYRYIGGDVYAETTNLNPNGKIAVSDVEPDNGAYPGALLCLTNLGSNIPNFDTSGAVVRNVQRTGNDFALTGLRRLSAANTNGTLQTLIFSQNQFNTMTAAELEALQVSREAQGWSVNVYRVSTNEFKIVVLRTINSGGVNLNLFIASRYSYIP